MTDELDDTFHLVGSVVAGRYAVERVVARGGFGLVYKATHVELAAPVALKVLVIAEHLRGGADAPLVERFRQEARTLATLKHPAIVRVLDVGRGISDPTRHPPWHGSTRVYRTSGVRSTRSRKPWPELPGRRLGADGCTAVGAPAAQQPMDLPVYMTPTPRGGERAHAEWPLRFARTGRGTLVAARASGAVVGVRRRAAGDARWSAEAVVLDAAAAQHGGAVLGVEVYGEGARVLLAVATATGLHLLESRDDGRSWRAPTE